MLAEKLREAKFVLTCTRYNKGYLSRFSNGGRSAPIYPVYHGLDLGKFASPLPVRGTRLQDRGQAQTGGASQNGTFQILSVGSLRECKGYAYLIEACGLLKERNIDFRCEIVGGGPEKRRLGRLVSRHGLEKKVRLTTYVPHEELISLYQRADVVALPALSATHFGIPNVLIEALAAKTPVICTPLPAVPELIEHMKSGLLVPEKEPRALADALENLSQDPELRRSLAAEGYARVAREFDIEKSGPQLEKIYLS
jgi:glycosyltransferase involved in cell wall biosynthesis